MLYHSSRPRSLLLLFFVLTVLQPEVAIISNLAAAGGRPVFQSKKLTRGPGEQEIEQEMTDPTGQPCRGPIKTLQGGMYVRRVLLGRCRVMLG